MPSTTGGRWVQLNSGGPERHKQRQQQEQKKQKQQQGGSMSLADYIGKRREAQRQADEDFKKANPTVKKVRLPVAWAKGTREREPTAPPPSVTSSSSAPRGSRVDEAVRDAKTEPRKEATEANAPKQKSHRESLESGGTAEKGEKRAAKNEDTGGAPNQTKESQPAAKSEDKVVEKKSKAKPKKKAQEITKQASTVAAAAALVDNKDEVKDQSDGGNTVDKRADKETKNKSSTASTSAAAKKASASPKQPVAKATSESESSADSKTGTVTASDNSSSSSRREEDRQQAKAEEQTGLANLPGQTAAADADSTGKSETKELGSLIQLLDSQIEEQLSSICGGSGLALDPKFDAAMRKILDQGFQKEVDAFLTSTNYESEGNFFESCKKLASEL